MELRDTRLITGLRRGAVELCVLAALRDGERYALDLARTLGRGQVLLTSEGTLYPLLARLRRDGLVETSWQESTAGPPRRYYRLSRSGRAAVDQFEQEWVRFRDSVDAVLKGDLG